MEPLRASRGKFAPDPARASVERALVRFRAKCRFEPETGCVVWTGGITMGRGHHDPYPSFWFDGKRWFGHRWSARYIKGIDIDQLQVDHCCEIPVRPNTLCVEHVQGLTAKANRDMQDLRRQMIHLQVGLLRYDDVYGPPRDEVQTMPFFDPPAWLQLEGPTYASDCPF